MACALGHESVWLEKHRYDEAEKNYVVHLSKLLNEYVNKPNNTNCEENNKVSLEENNKVRLDENNKVPLKENLKMKIEKTQNTTASPDTKKKKEKKNKRINKNAMKGGNNVVEQPTTEVVAKKQEESCEEKDDSHKSQSSNKAKKERYQKVNTGSNPCALVSEIAKARQHIKNSLERMDDIAALAAASPGDVLQRLTALENKNKSLVQLTKTLQKTLSDTQNRVKTLENPSNICDAAALAASSSSGDVLQNLSMLKRKNESLAQLTQTLQDNLSETQKRVKTLESHIEALTISKPSTQPAKQAAVADDDDGVDLFGSDSEDEDEAAAKIREQRLAEYAAKKSKKPVLIAKSSVVLDIKPWDDDTDLKLMEAEVRKITCDGLLWGASKFVPVAFGIQKLSISCVVEDEKVSIDWLTEEIEKNEDYVQSVDVAAFNKI